MQINVGVIILARVAKVSFMTHSAEPIWIELSAQNLIVEFGSISTHTSQRVVLALPFHWDSSADVVDSICVPPSGSFFLALVLQD